MYKIFFKERVVYLTNKIESDLTVDFGSILKYANQGELMQFIENFERNTSMQSAFIYHHNLHELMQNFRACFKNIPAAGGLVWNTNRDSFIGMKRLGFYDLPKGKVDRGETFEEAAVREVREECNIEEVSIERKLTTTYHTYRLPKHFIFKETRWFEMTYSGSTVPEPQKEENIESVFWLSPDSADKFVSGTYPSVLEVLKSSERFDLNQ
jgi:ADP-ribose pyrophosphatase YjhB (NUDIX family)